MVGPHSPDRARALSALGKEARDNQWPLEISSELIGSCTNSSYEDIGRAVAIAEQALQMGLKIRQPIFLSAGSNSIQETIERDGLLDKLNRLGITVLANACGPCIGQWKRDQVKAGKKIRSSSHSTEISKDEMMEIPKRILSLHLLKWRWLLELQEDWILIQ